MKNKTTPAIFLFAFLLRLINLGGSGLWYDEAFTGVLSRLPFERMLAATAGDVHPPLYYTLEWIVAHTLGSTEFLLRLPSAIFGSLAVVMVYQIFRALGLKERLSLLIALLTAIYPVWLYYGQEARMYALLSFLVLSAIYMILTDWYRGSALRYSIFVVILICIAYTHNYGVLYLLTFPPLHFVRVALLRSRPEPVEGRPAEPFPPSGGVEANIAHGTLRDRISFVLATYVIVFLAWLPWYILALRGQMADVASGYWLLPVDPGRIVDTLSLLFYRDQIPQPLGQIGFVAMLAVTLFGLARGIAKKRWLLIYLAFSVFAIAMAISIFWKPMLLFRGIIPALPFWVALAVLSLADLKEMNLTIRAPVTAFHIASLLCLIPLFAGVLGHYAGVTTKKDSGRSTIPALRFYGYQPGDNIFSFNDGGMVVLTYYIDQLPGSRLVEMPTCANPIGALSERTRQAIGFQRATLQDLPGRTWVIWSDPPIVHDCERAIARAAIKTLDAQLVYYPVRNEFVKTSLWLVGGKPRCLFHVGKICLPWSETLAPIVRPPSDLIPN